MPLDVRGLVAALPAAGALAGVAYTAFAIGQLRQFRKRVESAQESTAFGITVLKPLHGTEPRLYENLRTLCEQRYPTFAIVFGAADPGDPALDVARRLQHEFPNVDIDVVAGAAKPARNPKVGNLLGMADRIKHEIVVVADSDIGVPPEYLARIAQCFTDNGVGAATCLFTGKPTSDAVAATLGAMAINDHFIPSVLVAAAMEPTSWCLGATLAIRRSVLEQIGGFEAAAEHLADDYIIGRRVFEAGHRVALVPCVVTTDVTERSIGDLWTHETRWARTVYLARPAGFAGSIVTNPFPLALAALLIAPDRAWSWLVCGLTLAARLGAHGAAHKALRPQASYATVLVPVRDVLSLGVWSAAFTDRRLNWRGSIYEVEADGRMARGPKRM